MIYLQKNTEAQTVWIPADAEKVSGTFTLALRSTIDQTPYTFSNLADLSELRGAYSVALTLPSGIIEGEYEYELSTSEGAALGSGLAIVGAYERETTNIKVYEQ